MSLASESKIILQTFSQKQFFLNYLTPSIPFRLFKSSALHKELFKTKICLPLNRFTDPLTLCNSSSYVSVWGESHLQFMKLLKKTRSIPLEKLILKNPFKSQKFIHESIQMGFKTMVIDSFDQLWKIHKCRSINQISTFQQIPLNFVWRVSDPEYDLKQINILKKYNIKLWGLLFDDFQTQKIDEVKKLIQKLNKDLCEQKKIRTIYLEAESEIFDKIQNAYQTDEYFAKNKIETILQMKDFKMTNKSWIAARIIGQSRRKELILNEEAYNYIQAQQIRKGEIVEREGKRWLLSSVNHFPEATIMQQHQNKGYLMTIS